MPSSIYVTNGKNVSRSLQLVLPTSTNDKVQWDGESIFTMGYIIITTTQTNAKDGPRPKWNMENATA
jgi:hypothetical protein